MAPSSFCSTRSVGLPTQVTAAQRLPARHDVIKINSLLGAGYHIALGATEEWVHFLRLAVLQQGRTQQAYWPFERLGGRDKVVIVGTLKRLSATFEFGGIIHTILAYDMQHAVVYTAGSDQSMSKLELLPHIMSGKIT